MGVQRLERRLGEQISQPSSGHETIFDVLRGFGGGQRSEPAAQVDAVAQRIVACVFKALFETRFTKEQTGGQLLLWSLDVAQSSDDVQAIRGEQMGFVD